MNAVARQSAAMATRALRASNNKTQKRGIVNWMTNYPDKVMEIKKVQMKGGTTLGEMNPTWLKQPGDAIPLAVGAVLIAYGSVTCAMGHYKLATGKGKLD